ncbi:SH3 and multiple ankyrin repeat domains protein 1 [Ilyodon furcidens]|uniref:SH3 and multiple ankyrin repeat domains protein 1 n=1 Tax=Ilyodon furcidens TaxID=33524 RepID=A0ABV0UBC3_9TELE
MRFNPGATVWIAKQRILCTLNQTLKDVLNYGLFQPASNGRDGKFLDEERLLREYPQPFSKGVPCLEVRCVPCGNRGTRHRILRCGETLEHLFHLVTLLTPYRQ